MRKIYKSILQKYFCNHLYQTRADMDISQMKMAELLEMSERAYIHLEHGTTCCSEITLALYLTDVCEDPDEFLEGLSYAFDTAKDPVG